MVSLLTAFSPESWREASGEWDETDLGARDRLGRAPLPPKSGAPQPTGTPPLGGSGHRSCAPDSELPLLTRRCYAAGAPGRSGSSRRRRGRRRPPYRPCQSLAGAPEPVLVGPDGGRAVDEGLAPVEGQGLLVGQGPGHLRGLRRFHRQDQRRLGWRARPRLLARSQGEQQQQGTAVCHATDELKESNFAGS